MVQWLRLCAPDAGGLGSIPGQGNRSHMLQLRVCMGQEFAGARGSLRPGRVPEPESRPQRGACCPAKKKKKRVCMPQGRWKVLCAATKTKHIKKQKHYFAGKGLYIKGMVFSSSHAWI